jgi:DNA-binding transcriptional MerR regulator
MRTTELARTAGVKPPTLRYYERRGLLPSPERTGSGYRSYGPEALRIVQFVKRAQHLGFTLAEIETLLELAAGGPDPCAETRAVATAKIADLESKIAQLTAMREALQRLVDTCANTRAERDCPLLRALDTQPEGDSRLMTENTSWTALVTGEPALSLVPCAAKLLARGEPVPVADLAAAAGWPIDKVSAALRRFPRVDFDAAGNLAGVGLTLAATSHRVRIDGRELFTWCAMDAVGLPVMLGRPVTVESTCPATHSPIHLTLTPSGVADASPAATVVSEVAPTPGCTDIRTSVCDHGHFFADHDAAETWRHQHPTGHVWPLAEAFDITRERLHEVGWATSGASS